MQCSNCSFVLFYLYYGWEFTLCHKAYQHASKCLVALETSYPLAEAGTTCWSHSNNIASLFMGNNTSGYSLLWSPWQGSTEQNGTSVWPQAKEATSSALFSCFLSLSSPLFSPDSFYAGLLPHRILSAVSDTTWLTQDLAIESKASSQEGGGEIGFFNYTN